MQAEFTRDQRALVGAYCACTTDWTKEQISEASARTMIAAAPARDLRLDSDGRLPSGEFRCGYCWPEQRDVRHIAVAGLRGDVRPSPLEVLADRRILGSPS